MRRKQVTCLFFLASILILSCNTTYQSQTLQYKSYRVSSKEQNVSSINQLIQPYSDSVNKKMNTIVGIVDKTLDRKQPESSLGNFMVDAFFIMAEEQFKIKPDAAFLNSGGIRLNELPAGNLTNGKLFELMPFDNLLILQKLKGTVLQQLLNLIAEQGGWPIAGITMQIKDKKAINVMIGGKPIEANTEYITVNSDFVANGGGNADMLRPIPQISNGYLLRDALLDYVKMQTEAGKKITANIENRITNAQ
jgi:2',3'-cyclic-nucleotide 2'-phosphodiesterase (5'-nucleotidase family)